MSRLLIANLDFEHALTAGARPRAALPAPVQALLSGLGTAMAALGRDGDRLWTPAPVAAQRVVQPAWLPAVHLESGPLRRGGAARLLAWGESPEVAALRASPGDRGEAGGPREPAGDLLAAERRDGGLAQRWRAALWDTAVAPAVARRCNHRSFAFALAQARGTALPGACLVDSLAGLRRELTRAGQWTSDGAWVLKAPLSASGRDRLRRRSPVLDPEAEIRAERLLATHGSGLLEPWVERLADAGCAGLVTATGHWVFAPHGLRTEGNGVFRAVQVDDLAPVAGLHPAECEQIADSAWAAARALGREGYRGAFTIDAFAYRDRSGRRRLQPMCELNARLSFGLLARALAACLQERTGASTAPPVLLEIGAAPGAVALHTAQPLLHPVAADRAGGGLWLHTPAPPGGPAAHGR